MMQSLPDQDATSPEPLLAPPAPSRLGPGRVAFMVALALLCAGVVKTLLPGMRQASSGARAEAGLIMARAATRLLYFYLPHEIRGADTRSPLLSRSRFGKAQISQALAEVAAERYESIAGQDAFAREALLSAAILYGHAGHNETAVSLLRRAGAVPPVLLDIYSGWLPGKSWRPGPDVMGIVNSMPAGPLVLVKVYTRLGEPGKAERAIRKDYGRSLEILALITAWLLHGAAGPLILLMLVILRPWRRKGGLQLGAAGPWNAVEALLLWAVLSFTTATALEFVRQPLGLGAIWAAVISYVVSGGLAIAWFMWASLPAGHRGLRDLGWTAWRGPLAGLAGYCAIQPLVIGVWVIVRLFGIDPTPASPALPVLSAATGWAERAAAFILAALAAPIVEETLFRGIFYGALRRVMRPLFAAPISAVVFGLAHLDLASVATFAVLGVVLAYLYERTGSLVAPAVTHGLVNSVSTLLLMAVRQ